MTYDPGMPGPEGERQYRPPYQYQAPQQHKKPRKWIVPVVIGLVVAIVLCIIGSALAAALSPDKPKVTSSTQASVPDGGTEPKPDAGKEVELPKEQSTFKLKAGTTVEVDTGVGKHEVTVRSFKTYKRPCGDGFGDPERGMFLVADILVTVKEGTADVNPLFFEWVGDDGTTSDGLSAIFSGCGEPNLDSANNLPAGTKRAGKIVIDVANTKGNLEYGGSLFNGKATASWRP